MGKVYALQFTEPTGIVFDVQRYCVHDGPGIRTVVFLKGCPLSCHWCCNPESQSGTRELLFTPTECIGCGECIRVCPTGAAKARHEGSKVALALCTGCGACVDACPAKAIKWVGNMNAASEVFKEVEKDAQFYWNSGGGITISGGEPLLQADFTSELLRLSRYSGFNTAIETSGYASWNAFEAVLPYLDHVLYDIKHMDNETHRRLTGVGNCLIQANLERVVKTGVDVVARFPLIPGHNDSDENVEKTAQRVVDLGIREIHILPYHELGKTKYVRLLRDYELKDACKLPQHRINSVGDILSSFGLRVHIGG